MTIGEDDRLLLIAPHPDDELIAAGLALQKARKAGASIAVALITLGDAFGFAGPSPVGKKGAARRVEGLGLMRRRESLRALGHLGIDPDHVVFLGYPDRGLRALWGEHWRADAPYRSPFTHCCASPYEGTLTPAAPYTGEALLADLSTLLRSWRPTICVYPHPKDAHADHAAASVFVTYALELLAEEEAWALTCKRLHYLVHRGPWPSPRGPNMNLSMEPPGSFATLGERWVEVVGDEDEIKAKYQAILMYRSQIPPLGRFLTSFVRRNEIFSMARTYPVQQVAPGSLLIGGEAVPWSAAPMIADPLGDSLTRQVEKAGDLVSLDVKADGSFLFLRLETAGRVGGDVEYRLIFSDVPRSRRLVLRLKPPHRGVIVQGKRRELARDVVARPAGRRLDVAIPAEMLGEPRRLFLEVRTRSRGIWVDHTGHHLLHLPDWQGGKSAGPKIVYAAATPADLAACASVFAASFGESIAHVFRKPPPQRLIQEVFRLCYDAEPSALMVAVAEGKVAGYVYAPSSLRLIWRTALSRRHLLRWIGSWLRGRLNIGLAPLRVLVLDKFHFLRFSVGADQGGEARILSIAVAPEMRGRGIATRLLNHALDRFRSRGVERVRLEVRPWNRSAVHIYTRLGFKETGTARDTQGEWSIMALDLKGQ